MPSKQLKINVFLLIIAIYGVSCGNDRSSRNRQLEPEKEIITPPERTPSSGFEEDYGNTNRVIWQKPDLIMNLLGDVSNKVIADIGAGSGFFSLRMTPRAKKVIAIDIDASFVQYLDSIRNVELPPSERNKLETRLAEPNNPHLKPNEVDLVLIVNTYMYLGNRVQYLKNLKNGIRPGGRVIIVDFKKKRTTIGPASSIRVPQNEVEDELDKAGYTLLESDDTSLDYQYIVVGQKH
jgi:SAM-dependent methyltransferase